MSAYSYTAADAEGQRSKGYVEADSPRQARSKLRAQGLWPLSINEVNQSQNAAQANAPTHDKTTKTLITSTHRWRIGTAHLVMVTRQLATLLEAKLNIEESLSALLEQSDNERVQKILASLRSEVRSGHSLSHAMHQWPQVFPDMYRATVRAGEESGKLSLVMLNLADYYERRQELHQKVMAAFAYPAIVSLVALMVIVLLFIYVMPQVVQVFESTRQTLPLITRIMLGISTTLREQGLILLAVLVLSAWLFRRTLRTPTFRLRWDAWLLRLPLLSGVLLAGDAVRMSGTLSILAGSGVPLLTAIRVAQDNLTLLPLKHTMAAIYDEVREGRSFSKALESSKTFPPVMTYLVRNGEATGDMAKMLERAANQQQRELESRLHWLTTILGPLLIVVMGGIVGAIVLSVLLPIADLNQVVR